MLAERQPHRPRDMLITPLGPEGKSTKIHTTLLLHAFTSLFSRTAWIRRYQKCKTSLDLTETTDDGVWGCSGISWTICKQSAPCYRQITTSTPHHSIFTGRMFFMTPNQQCQSTEGKALGPEDKSTKIDNRAQIHLCIQQQ